MLLGRTLSARPPRLRSVGADLYLEDDCLSHNPLTFVTAQDITYMNAVNPEVGTVWQEHRTGFVSRRYATVGSGEHDGGIVVLGLEIASPCWSISIKNRVPATPVLGRDRTQEHAQPHARGSELVRWHPPRMAGCSAGAASRTGNRERVTADRRLDRLHRRAAPMYVRRSSQVRTLAWMMASA